MLTMQDKKNNKIEEIFDDRYNKSVWHIASHLRKDDFDEVFGATGESPHLAVIKGWNMALRRCIIFDRHGCAVAVVGVRPVEAFSRVGVIWLLGTDELNKISKFFLTISKPVIDELMTGFDVLYNYVDARYEKAIKWLKWCGFIIDEEPTQYGAFNLPYYGFYMRSN